MTDGQTLRVLYVLHNAIPWGCSSSLRHLIRAFPPGTIEPHVVCPPGPAVRAFQRDGIEVRLIAGVSMLQSIAGVPLRGARILELARTVWYMRHWRTIRNAIREVKPDVVHLNERGMLQAAWLASRAGVPVVMHARSVADRRTKWIKRLTDALTDRYVTRIVAIDESVSWSIRELPRRQVVYNPLPFSPHTVARRSPTRRTSIEPASDVRVTFLSGLLAHKGIWDLLESAKLLKARQDIVFQIAGTNARPPVFYRTPAGRAAQLLGVAPDLESPIRAWIARERLEATVRLLGHVEDVSALLAETDILVFPSHLNGCGRSVFEAGAMGIPSIVTLADKFEDVVQHGVTGLITEERNPVALAASIQQLADDSRLRASLGWNAQQKCSMQFDPPRIAAQMLDLYRTLAGSPGRETTEDSLHVAC